MKTGRKKKESVRGRKRKSGNTICRALNLLPFTSKVKKKEKKGKEVGVRVALVDSLFSA